MVEKSAALLEKVKTVSGLALLRQFTIRLKMNENQQLLAEYVRSGSEPAFRELVARYIDLVYSTGLRDG